MSNLRCLGIEQRYEVKFLEIGTDKDHVHFFGAIGSPIQRDKDCDGDQKHNGQRDFQTLSAGEEEIVGWRVLDGRVLRQHSGQARRRRDDRQIREEARARVSKTAFG